MISNIRGPALHLHLGPCHAAVTCRLRSLLSHGALNPSLGPDLTAGSAHSCPRRTGPDLLDPPSPSASSHLDCRSTGHGTRATSRSSRHHPRPSCTTTRFTLTSGSSHLHLLHLSPLDNHFFLTTTTSSHSSPHPHPLATPPPRSTSTPRLPPCGNQRACNRSTNSTPQRLFLQPPLSLLPTDARALVAQPRNTRTPAQQRSTPT